MIVGAHSRSLLKGILLNKETPVSRAGVSEGITYVRTITLIAVQTRAVLVIIASGDEMLVVVIPI
jgi:hypothetical protein